MHTRAYSLVVVAVVAAVVAAPAAGLAPSTATAATPAPADATDRTSVGDYSGPSGAEAVPAGAPFALDEHDDDDEDDGDGGSGTGNESVAGNESSGNESVAGNESSGNETRVPGPNVGSADVTVLREPGVVGEPLVVTATTTNNGTEAGRKVVQFEVGDDVVDSRAFVLAPGESRTETFVYTFETPGNHSFEVDAGRNRFVAVEPRRPSLDVLTVEASPASLSAGDDLTVTALVKNDGEANGTVSVPLELFGEVVTVRDVTLPAGETTEVSFTRTVHEPGSYEAVVGDRSAGFEVTADSGPGTTAGGPVVESASETPGFGPVVAVVGGVVAAAVLLWRRR